MYSLRRSTKFATAVARFRLNGSSLTLTLHRCEPDDKLLSLARSAAQDYASHLSRGVGLIRVFTLQELAVMPAWAHPSNQGGTLAPDPQHVSRALREARKQAFDPNDVVLRQCYDYMQNAREDTPKCLRELYKLIETIESDLGGEAAAIQSLNAKAEIKYVKRLANEGSKDQRHAPKNPTTASLPSMDDLEKAMRFAARVLRLFEHAIGRP